MEGAEVIVKTSRRNQKIKVQFQFNYPYTFPLLYLFRPKYPAGQMQKICSLLVKCKRLVTKEKSKKKKERKLAIASMKMFLFDKYSNKRNNVTFRPFGCSGID